MNGKRRLEDMDAVDTVSDGFPDLESVMKKQNIMEDRDPVSLEELDEISDPDCFGCKHFSDVIFNDEDIGNLIVNLNKIYTTSRHNLPNKVIAWQMKRYFDNKIKPVLKSATWSLESIEQHISKHVFFPTSEIYEQIIALRNYRIKLQDNVYERDSSGKLHLMSNNLKLLLMLDKSIIQLMEKKKNVADMFGYHPLFKM